jgi:spore coat protein U-like protein
MSLVRAVLAAAALAALLVPGLSRAQTCWFSTGPTTLAFGTYDPTSATPTDSTSTFTYACSSSKARPVVVWLGSGGAGSFNPRQLAFGADRLSYNLYTTALRNVIWGDGSGGTVTLSSTPVGSTHGATVTIYGRIAPGQWVAAGSYGDSVVVTLNF